jgi:hypothetical protein
MEKNTRDRAGEGGWLAVPGQREEGRWKRGDGSNDPEDGGRSRGEEKRGKRGDGSVGVFPGQKEDGRWKQRRRGYAGWGIMEYWNNGMEAKTKRAHLRLALIGL